MATNNTRKNTRKTTVIKEEIKEPVEKIEEIKEIKEKKEKKVEKIKAVQPKYAIGSIVFISKEADADLNGFKLFPQYKKYTYTVEAYDSQTDSYKLRRLNLLLNLNSKYILAPNEHAHDHINRRQF